MDKFGINTSINSVRMKTRGEDCRQTQRNTVKNPVEMCRAKNVSITTRDIDGGVVKDSECKAIDDREDGSAFDGDGESEDGGDSLGNVDGTEDLEKFTADGVDEGSAKESSDNDDDDKGTSDGNRVEDAF